MFISGKKINRLILFLLTLGTIESLNVSSGRAFAHLGQELLTFSGSRTSSQHQFFSADQWFPGLGGGGIMGS